MSWNAYDINNGGMPGYGGGWGGFGGGTGGAFLGGLAGGLVGDLFFDGRGRGKRDGCCDEGEKVVQINGQPYGNGCGYNNGIANWEIMKEVSDTRYDLSNQHYEGIIASLNAEMSTNAHINGLQMQLCQCCNETQRIELEGQYKAALLNAGLSRELAECCCKQLQATTVMGFETQLRDQSNTCAILKEIGEVKCLVKDVEMREQIRNLERENSTLRGVLNKNDIQDCIKDSFCKTSSGLNQIGVNQVNTAPATSQWPPFVPTLCC